MMLMQRKEQQAALNGAPSAEFAATETRLPSQKRDKETKTQGNPKPVLWNQDQK